jgi:23S rRNA pseudouridine2605 synthase
MDEKRLSKALAAAGIASRRGAEEMIFAGRVRVNGEVIRVPQTLIDWEKDEIKVDEVKIAGEEKKLYFMLNKPAGMICSDVRPGNQPIVLDLFSEPKKSLLTVGKLDRNATGLLIVTNDGHFADRVLRSSSRIEKEYIVKVLQEITSDHLNTLSQGARVDERWVRPLFVKKLRRGTFKISVYDGKKHEVRIIAERSGLEIVEIKRIRIGGLVLGSLGEGQYKSLNQKDIDTILHR